MKNAINSKGTKSLLDKIHVALLALTLAAALFLLCNRSPTESSRTDPNSNLNADYFFIVSPRAQCKVNIDSTMEILWIATDKVYDSAKVKITLYKDSLPVAVIALSAPNNGAFSYVMHNASSGSGYRIKISAFPDTTKYDFSDFFSLYSDYSGTITIAYPTSGSRLIIDQSDTIRWETTEFPGPRVRLDLYCDTTFVSTIVEGMATTIGTYPWGVIKTPIGTSTRYRIKATSESDGALFGWSEYFTISSIYSGAFTITAPSSSIEWASGYSYSILWDTIGSPGPLVSLYLYRGQTLYSSIATNVPDNGKYVWSTKRGMTTDSTYRIKIICSSDPGIYSESSLFTITGIASDSYEPDNKRSLAHAIPFDIMQNHTLTLNDTDWISFNPDSGQSYLFLSKSQDLFQINCAFSYDTGTTPVATISSLLNGTFVWLWQCSKNGNYFVRIVPEVSGNSGEYSFKVSRFDPSSLVSFSAPQAAKQIDAGTTSTIRWTPDTLIFGQMVQLYLFKGTKQISALSSASIANSGSFDWAPPAGFVTGDDYRIHLVSTSDTRLYGQGSVFSIKGTTPDAFENDDSRTLAKDITLTLLQNHSISYNDTDWIKFSATAGSRSIVIITSTDSLATDFTLFQDTSKASCLNNATSTLGSLTTMWTSTASAVYYGRMSASNSGAFGNYTITLLPFDSLTAISFAAPVSSSILVNGTTTTIHWVNNPIILGDSVSISIYKGNAMILTLAAKIPSGNPIFAWTVADSLKPGNDYRIKIANAANPSFCGFSPKFIISGIAPDSYEVDNTVQKASNIALGTVQQHTISYNDTDCIQFSADSGKQYVLSAIGAGLFRIAGSLQLVSSVTPEIALLSNSSGLSTTVWSCAQSGSYAVKIASNTYGATGSYAFKIIVLNPQTIAEFIAPATGTVWAVDSTYDIKWNSSLDLFGATVALHFFAGSTRLFPIVSSTANNGSFSWKIPSGLASGTTYRIQLVSSDNPSLYGFCPDFALKGMPGDTYEIDNTWAQAHSYILGTTELHTITYNDTDWVKFSADSGTKYILRVNGASSFRTNATVYNQNNWNIFNPYVSTTSGVVTGLWNCSKNTIAYVRLNASGALAALSGAYSLTITTFDSTKTVAFSSPTAGATFSAGNTIPIVWTPDTNFLGQRFTISVCKGTTTVLTNTYVANTGKLDFPVPVNSVLTGNDYRIKISSDKNPEYYGFSSAFSLSGIDAVPDGYEDDNTPTKARVIALNSIQQHNLILNDTDWIQFPMSTGVQYLLMGDRSSGSDIYVRLHYGSPYGSGELLRFNSNTNNIRNLTLSSGGTLYLEIYKSSSKVYAAHTWKIIPYDAANKMVINSPTAGQVITSGQNTKVSWISDTSIYGRSVTLYLYKGDSIAALYTSNNTGNFTWNANGIISGNNYRFKIASSNDTALNALSPIFTVNGVTLDAYEPDNTPALASSFTPGAVQQHNITFNDTDWIKISALPGCKYLFEYTCNATLEIQAHLYDNSYTLPSNSYLIYDYCYHNDSTISLWTCKTQGTYYLKVCARLSNYPVGNYALKITQFDSSKTARIISPTAGTVLTAGTANTISWVPDIDLYSSRVSIKLLKDSKISTTTYSIPNTGSYSWSVPSYLENGSDYQVCISRYDAHAVEGNLSPKFTITGGLTADSYEPDNVKNSAKLVAPGLVQYHSLPQNDTDWVKFQADSGTTYTIQDSTTSSKLHMILFNSNSGAWVKDIQAPAGQTGTSWLCTKADTYYIRITVYSSWFGYGTPGVYSLKITTP